MDQVHAKVPMVLVLYLCFQTSYYFRKMLQTTLALCLNIRFPPEWWNSACMFPLNQSAQITHCSLQCFLGFFRGISDFLHDKSDCVAFWCYKWQTKTKSFGPAVCLLPKLLLGWEPLFWCLWRELHIHPAFHKLLPQTSGFDKSTAHACKNWMYWQRLQRGGIISAAPH